MHSERLRVIEETLFQKNLCDILKGLKCSSWNGTDHQNAVADSKIRYFSTLVSQNIELYCCIFPVLSPKSSLLRQLSPENISKQL